MKWLTAEPVLKSHLANLFEKYDNDETMVKMMTEKTFPLLKELLTNEKFPLQYSTTHQPTILPSVNENMAILCAVFEILQNFIMKPNETSNISVQQEDRQIRIQILLDDGFFQLVFDILLKVKQYTSSWGFDINTNEKELLLLCLQLFLGAIQQGSSSQIVELLKNFKIFDNSLEILDETSDETIIFLKDDPSFAESFPSWLLKSKTSNKETTFLSLFNLFELADVSAKILQEAMQYLPMIKTLDEVGESGKRVIELEKKLKKLKCILEIKEMRFFCGRERLNDCSLFKKSDSRGLKSFFSFSFQFVT